MRPGQVDHVRLLAVVRDERNCDGHDQRAHFELNNLDACGLYEIPVSLWVQSRYIATWFMSYYNLCDLN